MITNKISVFKLIDEWVMKVELFESQPISSGEKDESTLLERFSLRYLDICLDVNRHIRI